MVEKKSGGLSATWFYWVGVRVSDPPVGNSNSNPVNPSQPESARVGPSRSDSRWLVIASIRGVEGANGQQETLQIAATGEGKGEHQTRKGKADGRQKRGDRVPLNDPWGSWSRGRLTRTKIEADWDS